ncbi:hypothetical protein TRIUR3_22821 [Triticum urartu]|uniref:Uncharacterized protein n=1 Tax=Triticum urartu TaxID=4572 RepID=M7Z021_TRIUA|nr:hypothetical protein TRIUR3_22821 [Triticum urartu]
MGSGFERFLKQLAQIEAGGFGAVEPMPTVVVAACPCHVGTDSHCVVCKEAFELGD